MAAKEALILHANEHIMSGRLIQLFRHLECKNMSIISYSIGIPRWKRKNGKKGEQEERRNIGTEYNSYRKE